MEIINIASVTPVPVQKSVLFLVKTLSLSPSFAKALSYFKEDGDERSGTFGGLLLTFSISSGALRGILGTTGGIA